MRSTGLWHIRRRDQTSEARAELLGVHAASTDDLAPDDAHGVHDGVVEDLFYVSDVKTYPHRQTIVVRLSDTCTDQLSFQRARVP